MIFSYVKFGTASPLDWVEEIHGKIIKNLGELPPSPNRLETLLP
jgi:hypothetical protein